MNADQIVADQRFLDALKKAQSEVANDSFYSKWPATKELVGYYKHELKATWDHFEAIATTTAGYTIANAAPTFQRLQDLGLPGAHNLFAEAFTEDKRMKLLGHLANLIDHVANKYHVTKTTLAKAEAAGKVPALLNKKDDTKEAREAASAERSKAVKVAEDVAEATVASEISPLKDGDGRTKTLAHYGIAKVAENFRNNITLLCDRLVIDWEDIEILFFQDRKDDLGLEDTCLKSLKSITTTGSDPHKGGKQAFILSFSAVPKESPKKVEHDGDDPVKIDVSLGGDKANTNAKNAQKWPDQWLVYKPGDMELDTRIVGDTVTIQKRLKGRPATDWIRTLPNLDRKSLFECVNEDNPGLELATYRLLPRGCASLAPNTPIRNEADKNDKDIPIQKAYGYIQFLAHRPNKKTANAASEDEYRDSDYITESDADVDRFYKHMGWILGIGHLIGMADAHKENSRLYKKRLHLIDNEICFKYEAPGIKSMMLTEVLTDATTGANKEAHESVLYKKEGNSIRPTFLPKGKVPNFTKPDYTPLLGVNNIRTNLTTAQQGLEDALEYLGGKPQKVSKWLGDGPLQKTVARITLRMTKHFGDKRFAFWGSGVNKCPKDLSPGSAEYGGPRKTKDEEDVENYPFLWTEFLKEWHDTARENEIPPVFAAQSPEFDWECYLNNDYPCHYRRLGSLDLVSARGKSLKIVQPLTPPREVKAGHSREICGPRYFQAIGASTLFTLRASRPAPTIGELDNPGQGLPKIKQFFEDLDIELKSPTYQVKTPGQEWRVKEPRLGDGFWLLRLTNPAPVRLWVQLCRNESDAKNAGEKWGPTGYLDVKKDDADNLKKADVTWSRLDADPKKYLKPFIEESGVKIRWKLFSSSGSTGTKLVDGSRWNLVEKPGNPYWFAQRRLGGPPGGGDLKVDLVRDSDDYPAGNGFGRTTRISFEIPTALDPRDLDANVVHKLKRHFKDDAEPSITLSDAAEGFVDKPRKLWHIVDGDEVYHVEYTSGGAVVATVAVSAAESSRRFLDRLTDDDFRKETISTLKAQLQVEILTAAGRTDAPDIK
jgi:hypothetical protein